MRQTSLITACACALLLFFGSVSGQNTFSVAYDTTNWIVPTTASPNDTLTYTLTVGHNLPNDYGGPIDFMIRVNGGQAQTLASFAIDSIPAGPGKGYVLPDSVVLSRYGGGINIVVVWPTAPNFVTSDSAFGEIQIINVSRPEPANEAYAMDIFPNPTSGAIHFRPYFPRIRLESMVLTDQQGHLLRQTDALPQQMALDGLAAGIYFLEMRMRDGAVLRFKVVKAQ